MLDQSFTPENFRKIFDYENRKGVYLEDKFFPDVIPLTGRIKELTIEIRATFKNPNKGQANQIRKERYEERKAVKRQKEEMLQAHFTNISNSIFSKAFQVVLAKNSSIIDKPVYVQEQKAEIFFALKQLQYNFAKLYKVKQANRYFIISQLKQVLNDGFPKFIVRTDLKEFYESIPHDTLQKKVSEDSLLSFFSKRIIAQILKEYREKAPTDRGLPRGVGISSYLAELYLRDLDNEIRSLPHLTYYARYVDDIVIIFTPPSISSIHQYLQRIKDLIESDKYKLKLNVTKTIEFDLRDTTLPNLCVFEYLGYKFSFGNLFGDPLHVELNLSPRKLEKYKHRIVQALDHYINYRKVNEKKARKLLIKRVNFLTSNTRLKNNKKNILTGIYHSHSLLTNIQDMEVLDAHFNALIDIYSLPVVLNNRLKLFSFVKGFSERRFIRFSTKDLHSIMKIWRKR